MAGIAGIASENQDEWVTTALNKIDHRGGAGKAVGSHQGASLGQVWPSAQELFASEIEDQAVVLDGEIHNWATLSAGATSPAEALGAAYREEGPQLLAALDGPFAMAIADADGMFLARDSLGKSPLYYGSSNDNLCFASEMKALLNGEAEVSEFPPGHYYHPREGLVRYAQIEKQQALDLPAEEVAVELRDRLVKSVRKRVREGETGSWLSGGLDSATMTALAGRQVAGLKTFGVGVEGAPDLEYARAVADYVGTEHHERLCTLEEMLAVLPEVIYHLESFDALLVRSSIMNFLVGKMASEQVGAVLSGEGGDELFAGYSYLKKMDLSELPDELVDITGRLHNTALQRVDRCSSSHGLVARTGFLDREVLDYALQIPAEMKLRSHAGGAPVEKWILRRAMDGLLPDEVLEREKSKFWEGSGVGEMLAEHAESVISDAEFAAERALVDAIGVRTKEELFYYRIFRDQFGGAVDPGLVGRTKGAPVEA